MRFDIATILPDAFTSYLNESIIKRAIDNKLIEVYIHDIRSFSENKHHKVDDIPFGGGAGMVMTPQPLYDCLTHIKTLNPGPVVYMTPQGRKFTQSKAEKLSLKSGLILLCGRYEGIDNRIRETLIDSELSIGDYVLTGGELAAMVILDSVARLIPNVLGKEESHLEDSFSKKLDRKKEYPHYTRPAEFKGKKVPEVLLSGNHKAIADWRKNHLK
ncbi:tRNA (guanosine(37)-N1)-methyltransferase TrmD [Candidatus Peregrinibacteria bacterium HGW-Peregrinibacteria-1]|jgi:tRNA (guanine37-N1)-methyltransferase|nr:MAG: tRNA (guanosine(37)-N1)-methyltransferase TrmD [Candidatus Peregrinibacteria bacterium HGW-Peregrinibacteria-1]